LALHAVSVADGRSKTRTPALHCRRETSGALSWISAVFRKEVEIENDLGNVAIDRQRYEEALRHFMRVVELDPRHEHSWFNVARTYRLLKNDAEAEVYYQRAIEEEPQNAAGFSELGSVYLGSKEPQKAYAIVEQGVRLHPQSAHMRGLLAGILIDMGELKRAQSVLEEAERIDPQSEMVQTVRKILETMKK